MSFSHISIKKLHEIYHQILPESSIFDLFSNNDEKKGNRKLRSQKSIKMRFCSSKYLIVMCKYLYTIPYKFCQFFIVHSFKSEKFRK